jgi:hypothetical protein
MDGESECSHRDVGYKHRHSTSSAVECWNSKVNIITGNQQPGVFLQVTEIKRESRVRILATEIEGN